MLPTPVVKADYDKVYEPAEDSFLLLDSLEKEKPFLAERFKAITPIVVEIGSGSGIVTTFLQQSVLSNSISLATDLNPHACQTTLNTSQINPGSKFVDVLQSNLTYAIRKNVIDVLVFNPPYVPAENVPTIPTDPDAYEWLDLALLGGNDGMIVTDELLKNMHTVLAPNGVAYILFCARNKPNEVAKRMESEGWLVDLVLFRKAGWEELSVYKFVNTL